MRSSLKLDQGHNDAIRAEVGDRLRVILRSGEQPKLPSRIQHLLDRLSKLDDEIERTNLPSLCAVHCGDALIDQHAGHRAGGSHPQPGCMHRAALSSQRHCSEDQPGELPQLRGLFFMSAGHQFLVLTLCSARAARHALHRTHLASANTLAQPFARCPGCARHLHKGSHISPF